MIKDVVLNENIKKHNEIVKKLNKTFPKTLFTGDPCI
jgi:hypothetical protein